MPVSDIGWLFDPKPHTPTVWYLGLVVIYAAVLVGSGLVHFFRRDIFPPRSLHLKVVPGFALRGAILGGVGLAL